MLIINFLLFQLAWFACVIGAAYQLPWLGVVITAVILSWHFSRVHQVKPEALLMSLALIIGGCFDQFMLMTEWVKYQSHGWSNAIVPMWILALWVAFASTLNVSLAWMHGRYLIALIFGAVGGPLAYLGADKLGAVTLDGNASYIALSIGWAIITPLLLYLTQHLNGFTVKEVS